MASKCEKCKNYIMVYSPILRRRIMTCNLTKKNVGCKGNYKEK